MAGATTLKDIKNQIKQKNLKPVYFLHGEEPYFIDLLAQAFEEGVLEDHEKAFNLTVIYGAESSASQVRDMAMRYPMMAPYQLIIMKEAQGFQQLDDLESYMSNPIPSTILVFCYKYKKLDARKKIAKHINAVGEIFESKRIYEDKLPSFVEEQLKDLNVKILPEASTLIAEHLGNDLSKIVKELDKMLLHIQPGGQVGVEEVHKYVGISKEYNIFELQKAVGARNRLKAFQICLHFVENPKTTPFIVINTMLFNYFSKLYKLHVCKETNDVAIAREVGIPSPYFVNEYKKAAKNYPLSKLEQIFAVIKSYDLKSKGVGADSLNSEQMLKDYLFLIMA